MAGEGAFARGKKGHRRRVPPLGNAPAVGHGNLLRFELFHSPAFLFFLAGAPFITGTPRQGALGGLTPLENEPAARSCDVEDGCRH